MKNKWIKVVSVLLSAVFFVGCTPKESTSDEPVIEGDEITGTVADALPPESTYEVEGAEKIVDLSKITEQELYLLDLDVMMASLEVQLPDYKEYFRLGDEDDPEDENVRIKIKDLLFYSLFGKTIDRWIADGGLPSVETYVSEVELSAPGEFEFNEESLSNLTREYMESLSTDEIADWYDGYYYFVNGEYHMVTEVDGQELARPITLGAAVKKYLTEDEKEMFKEELIDSLEEAGCFV